MRFFKRFFLILISIFLSNFSCSFNANANIKNKFIIVLDPGHGGKDPGAIGVNNYYEKNITSSVVNRLKKLIDLVPNWQAMRTRVSDKTIDLDDRVFLAKKYRANLFLSVHADATLNGARIDGISVFIPRYPNVEYKSRKIIDEFNNIFAKNLIRELDKVTPVHQSKVQRAGFVVLKSPAPSALVELGFMTNKKEADLLVSSKYQKRLAWGLFDAIQDTYKVYLEHPVLYKSNYLYKGYKYKYKYKLPKYFQYTVKKGDSLSFIANKFELTVSQLKCLLNKKSDVIYIGDKIRVPLQGVHNKC
jgi:N-acetylmuramoyl-L-alanine amidase